MKYCSNCGIQLDDGVTYCPSCGTFVGSSTNNNSSYNYDQASGFETSGLAIAGLVLAILAPFIGLIISIIANSDAKQRCDEKSQSLSRIGIIVAISIMAFVVVAVCGIIGCATALAFTGSAMFSLPVF